MFSKRKVLWAWATGIEVSTLCGFVKAATPEEGCHGTCKLGFTSTIFNGPYHQNAITQIHQRMQRFGQRNKDEFRDEIFVPAVRRSSLSHSGKEGPSSLLGFRTGGSLSMTQRRQRQHRCVTSSLSVSGTRVNTSSVSYRISVFF